MQQIYGVHHVSGRGRLGRVNDEDDNRRIELFGLNIAGFPTSNADSSLWLRPTPPRADLPLWRELNIPLQSIGNEACVGRSILALEFQPGSMIERGFLGVTIWTDLYETLLSAIVGPPEEFELSFTVASYGNHPGEWAYGDYGRGSPDRLGAKTIVFGHGHFSVRRLMLTVGQAAPRLP